jgi:hypothetical protein
MMNAIGDSLNIHASSNNKKAGEYVEDDKGDMQLDKLSKADEPSWVMSTLSKTVQQSMESFRQKLMKLHKLTQQGWGDVAEYFHGKDKRYGVADLEILVLNKLQMDIVSATPIVTTFGEVIATLGIISGRLQM